MSFTRSPRSFICALAVACSVSVKAAPRDVFHLSPAKPRQNDTLTVTYRLNDPTSAFRATGLPTLQMYVFSTMPDDPAALPVPTLREAPMQKFDSVFVARCTIGVPGARFVLYRFDSGIELDDNNGRFWSTVIFDSTGAPAPRALECRGLANAGYAADSSYRLNRDLGTGMADIQEELRHHPDNASAWDLLFSFERNAGFGFSPELTATIDSVMGKFAETPTEFSAPRIAKWYAMLGRREKLQAFEDAWLRTHAAGNYRTIVEFTRAKTIKSAPDVVNAVRNLVEGTKADSGWAVNNVREWLMTYYLQAGKPREAEAVLNLHAQPSALDLNRVALAYVETKTDIKHAAEIIAAAIAQEERSPSTARVPSYSMTERTERQLALTSKLLVTKARIEDAQNRLDSALAHYVQAVRFTRSPDTLAVRRALELIAASPHIDEHASDLPMLAAGALKNDELYALAESVAHKFPNVSAFAQLKEFISRPLRRRRDAEFCRHAMRLAAPPIHGRMLDGRRITPDSLAGKVVVIDFWGTWCAPCRITLPQFDNVAQQYRNNRDVVFLAIDTHEHGDNLDTIAARTQEFIDDPGLAPVHVTVPVMLDAGDSVATAFDVHVFPMFAVIDRRGILRALQYSTPDKDVADDLSVAIDNVLHGLCGTAP